MTIVKQEEICTERRAWFATSTQNTGTRATNPGHEDEEMQMNLLDERPQDNRPTGSGY
jgi:hypothetical protein